MPCFDDKGNVISTKPINSKLFGPMSQDTTPPTPSPSQPSATPRTNALSGTPMTRLDSDNFARQLERENAGLRREVEEAKLVLTALASCYSNSLEKDGVEIRTLRADLARLTAALEESGRDSERLDWLGEKHRSLSAFYTEASLPLWTAQYDAGHLTPRSAIDAARSAARKEGRT